jgi:ribosome-associated translation inhibitor RaiA
MTIPSQIDFRNMETSPVVAERIRERLAEFEDLGAHITRCHVTVEAPHRQKTKGNLYAVRIQLSCPGHDVLINRDDSRDHSHEDLYVAVRDAFDAAWRQLQDVQHKRERRTRSA